MRDGAADGKLGIYLSYRSGKGVNRANDRIKAMGGTVRQIGNTEIAGTVPVGTIDHAIELIRLSKLAPGDPQARPPARSC